MKSHPLLSTIIIGEYLILQSIFAVILQATKEQTISKFHSCFMQVGMEQKNQDQRHQHENLLVIFIQVHFIYGCEGNQNPSKG